MEVDMNAKNQAFANNSLLSPVTAHHFSTSLEECTAILEVLVMNLSDFKKDDGMATDEALVLSLQHVTGIVSYLENITYDFEMGVESGEVSLVLMRSRALLEIIEGMFDAQGWKIDISKFVLLRYLRCVKKMLETGIAEVLRVYDLLIKKAA